MFIRFLLLLALLCCSQICLVTCDGGEAAVRQRASDERDVSNVADDAGNGVAANAADVNAKFARKRLGSSLPSRGRGARSQVRGSVAGRASQHSAPRRNAPVQSGKALGVLGSRVTGVSRGGSGVGASASGAAKGVTGARGFAGHAGTRDSTFAARAGSSPYRAGLTAGSFHGPRKFVAGGIGTVSGGRRIGALDREEDDKKQGGASKAEKEVQGKGGDKDKPRYDMMFTFDDDK